MLILGIDPGIATTGYGVIEVFEMDIKVIDYGLIETNKNNSQGQRLTRVHDQLESLLRRHQPDVFAIERLFFATNAKTAMTVGQACGVMLMAAARFGVESFEYAPGNIKKLITGSGRADKKMVQESVRKILGPRVRVKKGKKTHFDNAADALAVALCHVFNNPDKDNFVDLEMLLHGKS